MLRLPEASFCLPQDGVWRCGVLSAGLPGPRGLLPLPELEGTHEGVAGVGEGEVGRERSAHADPLVPRALRRARDGAVLRVPGVLRPPVVLRRLPLLHAVHAGDAGADGVDAGEAAHPEHGEPSLDAHGVLAHPRVPRRRRLFSLSLPAHVAVRAEQPPGSRRHRESLQPQAAPAILRRLRVGVSLLSPADPQ